MPCKPAKFKYHPSHNCGTYAPFDQLSNGSPLPCDTHQMAADQAFMLCDRANYGVHSNTGLSRCLAARQKHLEAAYM
jgi:hypothetical protein